MADDLHIFADLAEYRRFHDTGGGGRSLFRDPKGKGLTYDACGFFEVRDIYLHNGVVVNVKEETMLISRQRHHYSSHIYRVAAVRSLTG